MPSCRRCTHCTARTCTPSLPQDLLQAPHSSATQLPGREKTDTAKALEGMPAPGGGRHTLNAAPKTPPTEGVGASKASQGGLTPAGSTPAGYSVAGSALASCRCHRSFDAPSGCRFSAGSRTWCTGCLRGHSRDAEAMGAGVPPAPWPVALPHPCRLTYSRMSPLRRDQAALHPGLQRMLVWVTEPQPQGEAGCCGVHTERGAALSAFPPPHPPLSCAPKNPGRSTSFLVETATTAPRVIPEPKI